MGIDCTAPECPKSSPPSMLVAASTTARKKENTDCSTNILYLTDDAGLVNQSDDDSDPYLTVDDRYRQISTTQEVDLHFSACSHAHYELNGFFDIPKGSHSRPPQITVAYFDSEAETMADAIEAIIDCNRCFYTVTHSVYDKNGNELADSDDQFELAEWAQANGYLGAFPTMNDELINPTETATNAYKSKQAGHSNIAYMQLVEECVPVLDENCEPTGEVESTYGYQHMLLAGVMTSVSMSGADASLNVNATPLGAPEIAGISTSRLNDSELWAVMGDNINLGGVQSASSHHVNVYRDVAGRDIILTGITSTGQYIDEVVHAKYMEDALNSMFIDILVNNKTVSMRDSSALKIKMNSLMGSFVSKGIIDNTAGALDKSEFGVAWLEGNGWIIEQDELTDSNISSRSHPALRVCAARPDSVNTFQFSICGGV